MVPEPPEPSGVAPAPDGPGSSGRPQIPRIAIGDPEIGPARPIDPAFRHFAEATPALVWSARPDGEIDFSNRRFLDYLGTALAREGGPEWGEALHPDDAGAIRMGWEEARSEGSQFEADARLRRHDGRYRWHRLRATPMRDEAGLVARWVGTATDIDDGRRAEDRAALLARALECMAEGVGVSDQGGTILHTNPAEDRMFGYGPGELVGRHVSALDARPPGEDDRVVAGDIGRLEAEGSWSGEWWGRRKDGTPFRAFVRITAIEVGGERFRVCVREAIPGGEASGEALRESERRLRQLADTMPQVVWTAGPDGAVDAFNARWYEYTGMGPGEALAHEGWRAAVHPDDLGRLSEARDRAVGEGDLFEAEVRLRRRDGAYRWHLVRSAPVRDEAGRVARRFGTATDIDDRRKAEQALRASEAQHRAIYDQAAVGIAEVDLDGRFLRANARYGEIVGHPPEELLGRRFREITHPDDPPGHRRLFDRIAEGASSYTIRKRYVRKDGRAVWANTAVSLIRDGAGRPGRVVAVVEDITERVRLEAELLGRMDELARADRLKEELLASLREGEERFRSLMEQAPFSIQILDPGGATLRVNRAWERLWGLTLDQVADYNVLEDPQLGAKGVLPFLRRAFGGEPSAVPAIRYDLDDTLPDRSRHADPRRWVSAVAYPLKDAEGRVREVVLVHDDITERREAEEALRASEERFRHLAEAVPHLVWITRPDRSVEYVNRRWLEYTGQSMEQALGPEGWREAVHPDDLGRVVQASVRSHATGEPLVVEYRLKDASGSYRWHLGRAVPVFDEAGRVARRFGTATDIDDRRKAEQAARFLSDAGATLAALVDEESTLGQVARLAVPFFADCCAVDLLDEAGSLRRVAVAHVDQGKVEWAHELHRRYPPRPDSPHGVPGVVRSGRPEIVPEVTDEMLALDARDEEHLRLLRGLRMRSYLCVPLAGRGGTMGAISFVAADSGRRFDADDVRLAEDLAHRAAIAIDNTRLYDRLREADRRKDEFLATLAHELRNPLAPIRNALLLMRGPAPPGGHEPVRAMAERQVAHLARLVDDLMDVARISEGKIELRRESVDLHTVVRQAVETARPLIDDRRHRLVVTLPPGPVRLEGDPTRLEQVLWNLLNNAAKYTGPGGRIDLSAEAVGGQVVVRVRDTGVGIEPSMLPRLFRMFVQLGEHKEHARGGLGIGLGLVRTLVELHGGTITALSEGPGKGSEFVVRLPSPPGTPAGPAAPEARDRGAEPGLSRRRILVVDDNVDGAVSLARLLELLHGHEVQVAHDGPSALEVADRFRPEVVLLDIGLPGMDGHEVARRLRARPEFGRTPLVALTGWGQESDRRRSREAGFDHHLVKPVDLDALSGLLAEVVPSTN
jgi:PAS domain S-box-containing protein